MSWLQSRVRSFSTVFWLWGILIFSWFQHSVTFHFIGLGLKLHPVPVGCQLPHFCHILYFCGRSEPAVMSAWWVCKKEAHIDSKEERVMEEVSSDSCFLLCFSMLFPLGYSMCQVQAKDKRNRPWQKDPRKKRWKNTDRISTCRSTSPPFLSFSLSFSISLFPSLL